MTSKGILVEDSGEFQVKVERENGEIVQGILLGNNIQQRVRFVVEASKGEFKERPTLGFGILRFVKAPKFERTRFVRELMVELESEGFKKPDIQVNDDLSEFKVIVE